MKSCSYQPTTATAVHARRRSGLSVLEVMFALGIAVFGLLGIAALLPLASRNASESVRMAEAQSLAHQWYDDLMVTGAANSGNWMFFQDFAIPPTNPAGYKLWGGLTTIRSSSSTATRLISRQAICIDPYFLTSRDIQPALVAGSFNQPTVAAHRWYRPAVFPYYLDTYNPVVDPVYTVASHGTYALPEQPRMVRVTLGAGGIPISRQALLSRLGANDDLATFRDPKDSSISVVREVAPGSSSMGAAKMASMNEYSWFATICPNDTLVNNDPVSSALLSVVVVHKRDLLFYSVASPPLRGTEPDTEGKPKGELLFRVVPQYNVGTTPVSFLGGSGGSVTLVASDGVSNKVRVGDWLMLGRNRPVPGNATATAPLFRWYRIIATEGEPEVGNISLFDKAASATSAPDNVWARRVTLEGPDWVFDDPSSATFQPTTATYVPGAVAVYERVIPW